MVGMPLFERQNIQDSSITLNCINAFSVNEKLFSVKLPVTSQVAECLEEASSNKFGDSCMGDVYESDFGLDPYTSIGSNYVESFINKRPINGFDGNYYVDWTFSEKQRLLVRDSLEVYKKWIGTWS